MPLRPGDRVDRYTLVRPLGEGGQGSVWKVVDPLDGGSVRALKLVYLGNASSAAAERARREAHVLAKAKHPALVDCHGLFEDPKAGLVGLVLELVKGTSAAEAASDPRMTQGHRFALLAQIVMVLAYIHSLGLVHRDLKLENILVADGFWLAPASAGAVKLVDFGIAAQLGNPQPLTVTGGVVGTLPYMAPELVDPATWGRPVESFARDLFAFGVLAHKLLFGAHPSGLRSEASAVDYARAYKAAEGGVLAWPQRRVDGPWGVAIRACLALRPGERPESGAALAQILRRGVDPMAATARAQASERGAQTVPHSGPALPPPPRSASATAVDHTAPHRAPTPLPPPVRRLAPTAEMTAPYRGSTPLPPAPGSAPDNTAVVVILPHRVPTPPTPPVASTRRGASGAEQALMRASSSSKSPPSSARPALTTPMAPESVKPRRGARDWSLRTLGWVLAIVAVGVACALVLAQLVTGKLESVVGSGPTPSSSRQPAPAASTQPRVIPDPPSSGARVPVMAPRACSTPCCGGAECAVLTPSCASDRRCKVCASGRSCVPGKSSDSIERSGKWLLRVARVAEVREGDKEVDLFKRYKDARVCVRLSLKEDSSWQCTPLVDAADRPDARAANAMKTRLPVTTADLLPNGGGIDIHVMAGEMPLAELSGAFFHDGLKKTALCRGVFFELNKRPVMKVYFYLDDDEP